MKISTGHVGEHRHVVVALGSKPDGTYVTFKKNGRELLPVVEAEHDRYWAIAAECFQAMTGQVFLNARLGQTYRDFRNGGVIVHIYCGDTLERG